MHIMATPIEVDGIPVVDVAAWLNREDGSAACEEECAKVAAALHQYGVLCVKDPRVSSEDNDRYVESGQVSASTSEPLRGGAGHTGGRSSGWGGHHTGGL